LDYRRANAVEEILVKIHIEALSEGGFLATSEEVQGLVAEGRTIAETMEIARDVVSKLVESCIEHGDALPPVLCEPQAMPVDLFIPVAVDIPVAAN